jgi:hypothetical protein
MVLPSGMSAPRGDVDLVGDVRDCSLRVGRCSLGFGTCTHELVTADDLCGVAVCPISLLEGG